MSRSLNIHDDCISQTKLALRRNGFHSQRALAESVGFSLSTVGNFLRGKPVDFATFSELCDQLGLDWRSVSSLNDNDSGKGHNLRHIKSKPAQEKRNYQDWSEAIDVAHFYDRSQELEKLRTCILTENCRLITLLGMGGVGKTSLAVKLAQQVQDQFDIIIFRSLRNAPRLEPFVENLIQVLSRHQAPIAYTSLSDLLSSLIKLLQANRCLLILDNAESILEDCDRAGRYRTDYEGYGQLLNLVGATIHQSCLILTSREKPQGFKHFEGNTLPVRCFHLRGLSTEAGRQIFDAIGLYHAKAQDWSNLIEQYAGNPLALRIVAAFIRDFFNFNVSSFLTFLKTESFIFDDIKALLDQQICRLSPVEVKIMYWLAINREPTSLPNLQSDLVGSMSQGEILQAIVALKNRSLIEQSDYAFTLQPVVMEYMTTKLIQAVSDSIAHGNGSYLTQYALIKAQSSVAVTETQARLIVQPIIEALFSKFETDSAIVNQLYTLLSSLRGKPAQKTGYFCGNLLYFAKIMNFDLKGYDFSGLTVWQANLQGMLLQNTNFSDANMRHSVFSEILDEVRSTAFSPDGQYLAIADQNCKVSVWSMTTHQRLWVGHKHTHPVFSVTFSAAGKTLASASADHTVILWDIETGACKQTFKGHQSEVCAVAFSPDGRWLVSGSKDCTLKLWNVQSGEAVKTLRGHQQAVVSVAFSPDGSQVASGSSDTTIKLWDLDKGICQKTLQGHQNWVLTVAFCPKTQQLASGSSDRSIKLWDCAQGNCIQTLTGHTNWVLSLAYSPDGILVSGSGDQMVKVWEPSTRECLHTLVGHHHGVFAVAASPDGRMISSGGYDQTIRLWNIETGSCLKILQGHTNRIFSVDCSPDGQTIASGSFDQSIRLWNRNNGTVLREIKGHTRPVYALAFSPDGQLLASGSGDHTVKLWHYSTGRCVNTLRGHLNWVYSVGFSPDSKWLISGSGDHTLKLWQVSTGECIRTFVGHQTWIWSVMFSPDGQCLASGSGDRTIKIWDPKSGSCIRTLEGHSDRVYSVAFSPDGRMLASGSFDHTIRLWDIATGQCLHCLSGHTNGIYSVAFSPDGTILASGSLDHTIRLWDMTTGQCLKTYEGHENEVRSLAFLPPNLAEFTQSRSLQFVSGSQDQSLRIWTVDTGKCEAILRVKPLYDGMNITGVTGLTTRQKASLKVLGAVEYCVAGESRF